MDKPNYTRAVLSLQCGAEQETEWQFGDGGLQDENKFFQCLHNRTETLTAMQKVHIRAILCGGKAGPALALKKAM